MTGPINNSNDANKSSSNGTQASDKGSNQNNFINPTDALLLQEICSLEDESIIAQSVNLNYLDIIKKALQKQVQSAEIDASTALDVFFASTCSFIKTKQVQDFCFIVGSRVTDLTNNVINNQ